AHAIGEQDQPDLTDDLRQRQPLVDSGDGQRAEQDGGRPDEDAAEPDLPQHSPDGDVEEVEQDGVLDQQVHDHGRDITPNGWRAPLAPMVTPASYPSPRSLLGHGTRKGVS